MQAPTFSYVTAIPSAALACLPLYGTGAIAQAADQNLLKSSYDSTCEPYRQLNASFIKYWKIGSGDGIKIRQLHDGSGEQMGAVIDDIDADVETVAFDNDAIATRGLLGAESKQRAPYHAAKFAEVQLQSVADIADDCNTAQRIHFVDSGLSGHCVQSGARLS